MGMDIHIHIFRGNEVIAKEIYDGRNSEWFRNLQGDGWDNVYDSLDYYKHYGLPEEAPEWIKETLNKDGYFGHFYLKVGDFITWFEEHHPERDAGWVTTYDKWRIERQNYIPEDVKHYLDEDDIIEDMHFVEFEKKYDNSKWLYYYVKDYLPDDIIIIYFDW